MSIGRRRRSDGRVVYVVSWYESGRGSTRRKRTFDRRRDAELFDASIGAGISMAFSEGLSDTGELTGRGNPLVRGGITGIGTFVGGILHSLPFLIPNYHAALVVALIVVAFELVMLAWIRWRYFDVGFLRALATVTLGGVIIAVVSAGLGSAA